MINEQKEKFAFTQSDLMVRHRSSFVNSLNAILNSFSLIAIPIDRVNRVNREIEKEMMRHIARFFLIFSSLNWWMSIEIQQLQLFITDKIEIRSVLLNDINNWISFEEFFRIWIRKERWSHWNTNVDVYSIKEDFRNEKNIRVNRNFIKINFGEKPRISVFLDVNAIILWKHERGRKFYTNRSVTSVNN